MCVGAIALESAAAAGVGVCWCFLFALVETRWFAPSHVSGRGYLTLLPMIRLDERGGGAVVCGGWLVVVWSWVFWNVGVPRGADIVGWIDEVNFNLSADLGDRTAGTGYQARRFDRTVGPPRFAYVDILDRHPTYAVKIEGPGATPRAWRQEHDACPTSDVPIMCFFVFFLGTAGFIYSEKPRIVHASVSVGGPRLPIVH